MLEVCAPFLVGGERRAAPYRIYHQSFREFLLDDEKFTVYPAERHAAIARYLQDRCGANWGRCDDPYALRYTPAHWADAATLSEAHRDVRTHGADRRRAGSALSATLREPGRRSADVALATCIARCRSRRSTTRRHAAGDREGARGNSSQFRREYLRADRSWRSPKRASSIRPRRGCRCSPISTRTGKTAARLILAWIAADANPQAALALRQRAARPAVDPTLQLAGAAC